MAGKIPSLGPKGKKALKEGVDALSGEGKIAETILGKLNSNLKEHEKAEEKTIEEENEAEEKRIEKDLQQEGKAEAKSRANFSASSQAATTSAQSFTPDTSATQEATEKAQEEMERKQQEQEQEAELQRQIDEEKREKIEKLKQERDAKIEAYRNGKVPPFIGFFMNNISLYLMGLVDFGVGWIPFVGDIIMFFVSAAFWFIPSFFLFDLMAYIKILIFLFVDMIIGMIPMNIGNFADLLPEFLLVKWGPPAQLRKAWKEKLPAKLERIRQDYDSKIAIVQANERDKLKKRLGRLRGHFSGLAIDNRKILFLLFFVAIIVLGPFGIGAFSETHLLSSLPVIIVLTLFLLLATKLGMLDEKEMFGLLLFLALNIALSVMLKAGDFLAQYFKGNTIIVMILFFVFSTLFVLKSMDVISGKAIAAIIIILLLILSSFQIVSQIGSPHFKTEVQQSKAEKQVAWDNANLFEKMRLWITEQKMKGNGTYLPAGETESTYTFMGVTMENPSPLKTIFYSTEPIQIDIDYQANSYDPISISTSCKTGTYMGVVEPNRPVQATASYFPRVSCIFDHLPPGAHKIDVKGVYNYRSTVRFPLQLISADLENTLLVYDKDSKNKPAIESLLEENKHVLTSAGPIQIGVSNTKEMGVDTLKMPMAMDVSAVTSNTENRIHKLKFQLQSSYDTSGGIQKIERVTRAQFNMPEGLALSHCNFAPGMDLQPLTEGGRWIYDVLDDFNKWNLLTTIECEVLVSPEYANVFFPQGVDWSKTTMLFSVDYDYSIQKSVVVQVEA